MISKFQHGIYAKICFVVDIKPKNDDRCHGPCGTQFEISWQLNLARGTGLAVKTGQVAYHPSKQLIMVKSFAVNDLATRADLRALDKNIVLRRDFRHLTIQ